MYQLIFRNWKFAALWAIGISASVAAFFEPGDGQEQLAASAEKIESAKALESAVVAQPAPPMDEVAIDDPLSEEDAAAAEAGAPVMDTTEPVEKDPTEDS